MLLLLASSPLGSLARAEGQKQSGGHMLAYLPTYLPYLKVL